MTAAPTETPEAVVFRRRFLNRMSLALGALAGAVVSVPILAYLLSPIINPAPNVWRDLGDLDDFTVGDTVEVAYDEPSPLPWAGQTARSAVWPRRTGAGDFVAFALNCTHLGCPVNCRPLARGSPRPDGHAQASARASGAADRLGLHHWQRDAGRVRGAGGDRRGVG